MKVNIVTEPPGHIIPKMMGWLNDKLGWSIQVYKADPSADINYYASYLTLKTANPVKTKKAAWFTHFEEGSSWKEKIWNDYADKVDLRLSCVEYYVKLLKKKGLSKKITPGVDRKFFQPTGSGAGTKRVGVSGLAQPRKGEGLVMQLAQEKINIQLVITGQGWKLSHVWLPEHQMPNFFSMMDVFLCTSLIEGVPMPPLEALACGTKIVVRKNVGMLDELPETKGVRHYIKGDYADMLRALKLALADKVDPATLRSITDNYTINHWAESHKKALNLLFKKNSPK